MLSLRFQTDYYYTLVGQRSIAISLSVCLSVMCLRVCLFPLQRRTKTKQKNDLESRRPIILPYVKGTSERVALVMKRHRVSVTMRLVKTVRRLLVHLKDKQEKE